jgi:hypothetical protein
MSESDLQDAPYARAWQSYRWRNRLSNTLTAALVIAIFGGGAIPHNIAVAIGICVLMVPVNVPLMFWPCPRCKASFFWRKRGWQAPFQKACPECGLKKWAVHG